MKVPWGRNRNKVEEDRKDGRERRGRSVVIKEKT